MCDQRARMLQVNSLQKSMEERQKPKGLFGWFIMLIVLAVISFAIWLTVHKKNQDSDSGSAASVPGPPVAINSKYTDALNVAMQFFDVQKSGKLVDNKIKWRGDSTLDDGKETKVNLSKGMYDAVDHMKFGFPMAFTATVLSWSILEYGDQMQKVDLLESVDHKCRNRPDDMKERRHVAQVNISSPGSDVAAETVAAMKSAFLVFKSSDFTCSNSLLKHAQQLFSFSDNRGLHSMNIPQVQTFYNSTGYGDELIWVAGWFYHATGDQSYIDYVTGENGKSFARWETLTWFSWDDKLPGAHVLLSRVNFFGSTVTSNSVNLQNYKKTDVGIMCNILPKSPRATISGKKWFQQLIFAEQELKIDKKQVLIFDPGGTNGSMQLVLAVTKLLLFSSFVVYICFGAFSTSFSNHSYYLGSGKCTTQTLRVHNLVKFRGAWRILSIVVRQHATKLGCPLVFSCSHSVFNTTWVVLSLKQQGLIVVFVIARPKGRNHFSIACARVKLVLEQLWVNTNNEFKRTELSAKMQVSLTHYSTIWSFYNEQIRDLRAASPSSKKLEIKQDSEGFHFHHIPGIGEAKVENIKGVWNVLKAGSSARAAGAHSSRSHYMFCIMVKAKNLKNVECIKNKLWLVDLTDSKRLAKTDVQGDRLKEARNIARSLSALGVGDMISALAANSNHIPCMNSKLTHLLQDSLGGDSKTLMFVLNPTLEDKGVFEGQGM